MMQRIQMTRMRALTRSALVFSSALTLAWPPSAIGQSALDGWVLEQTPNPGASLSALLDVHAFASDDVWAVGWFILNGTKPLAIHWDGVEWSQVELPATAPSLAFFNSVHGTAPNDVWAVGDRVLNNVRQTLIMHWDGTSWSIVPSPNPDPLNNSLRAVRAIAPNDVWAVGHEGKWDVNNADPLALHWNGSEWSVVPTPAIAANWQESLDGIAASSSNDVWAVGSTGVPATIEFLAMHYDGSAWQIVEVPQLGENSRFLEDLVVFSPTNLTVVGTANFGAGIGNMGVRMHFDGAIWTPTVVKTQFTSNLWDIAASGPDDILTVGERNVTVTFPQAFRLQNEEWTFLDLEQLDGDGSGATRGCSMLPSGEAWVVGTRFVGSNHYTRVYHYIPPVTVLPGDTNADGVVNVDDLLAVINSWGQCAPPPADCSTDFTSDGWVNVDDLLVVINNWSN